MAAKEYISAEGFHLRAVGRRPVYESAVGFFGNASYTESRPALRRPFALGLIGGGFPLRPLGGFQALL